MKKVNFIYVLYRIGWFCSHCNTFYDLKHIESYLIETLHSKIMMNVTQDIQCEKCKEVKLEPTLIRV